jgi:methyltransferase (TIGR00027 family)
MPDKAKVAAESSAVRVALWRALHVLRDPPPHVIDDQVGLKLAAPDEGWEKRPDMDLAMTSMFRASIVARARLFEDLVVEQSARGVDQYVILGAGLDTFVQRRTDMADRVTVYEIDQPGLQAWKEQRLKELGYGIPTWQRLVPVDFEAGADWRQRLAAAGFALRRPALVASGGVSMYLTKAAVADTLRKVAGLAPGSTLAMTFMLPFDMAEPGLRPALQGAERGARASGTPWLSYFTPTEMLALARECGFKKTEHISAVALTERYFAGRPDGLRLPINSEEVLVAST